MQWSKLAIARLWFTLGYRPEVSSDWRSERNNSKNLVAFDLGNHKCCVKNVNSRPSRVKSGTECPRHCMAQLPYRTIASLRATLWLWTRMMAKAKRLPRHVGISTDGNRRWAQDQGFEKKDGYHFGLSPWLKFYCT